MVRFSRHAVPALTVLEHIRAHLDPSGCGLLPGGHDLPGQDVGENEIRWAPGAADGVGSHHMSWSEPEIDTAELISLMGSTIARGFRPKEFGRFYERIRSHATLSYADALLDAIRRSALPPDGVHELGKRLATEGRHVEPVKLGIALLGLFESSNNRDLLLTLGRSEELTLYCAVAIANTEADPEPVLWSLARGVDGWGRIHTVERLKGTPNEEIQEWLVREGFRNQIMYEYLAYIAATTGRLLERLQSDPDDELVDSAGEIVAALISGGPAEDIDDYEAAPDLLKVLLGLLEVRATSLAHFVVVVDIERFLQTGDWEARLQGGWTQERRAELLDICRRITTQDRWVPLVEAGLDSDDDAEFWRAQRAADALGIDTFPALWRRLEANSVDGDWWAVMQHADSSSIGAILELAERSLPLDAMGSGPSDLLGLGPEFAAETALGSILQDLGRFPGHGWPLVRVGLRSPVIRVRNMAVKALSEWPHEAWPADALAALEEAARIEPDERVREWMNEVLSHG